MEATFAKLESQPNISRKVHRDEVINTSKSFEPLSPTVGKLRSMLVDTKTDLSEIISRFISDEMKRYISERRLSGRDQIQAELEVLDTHYVEVGGIIAEH